MTLYEINKSIYALIEGSIDQETGELNIDPEQFEELQLEQKEKRENIALCIKNLSAEIDAIESEEVKLFQKRKKKERTVERLKSILENDLAGEKFSTARVEINYRKSSSVEVDKDFVEWAQKNGYDNTLRYKAPEPDKKCISELLKSGVYIPYARIVQRTNMTIK